MTDLTTPPPMPSPDVAHPGRFGVVWTWSEGAITARDAIWAERVASLLKGDPAVPVVAWEYVSEDPYDAGELMLSHVKPDRQDVRPLVELADHAAAIASLQARLDAAERALESVRQQARIWHDEANVQKATVDAVGRSLGGVPDWGPIVAGVESMKDRLDAAERDVKRYRFWRRFYRSAFAISGRHQLKFMPGRPQVEIAGPAYEQAVDAALDAAIAATQEKP